MSYYSELFTLDQLKLKLPPLDTNATGKAIATPIEITYDHGSQQGRTTTVLVTHHQHGWRFCFGNTFTEENALVASIQMDNPRRPLRVWTPPHWHVLKSRGVSRPYIITGVSWDEDYQKRFSNPEKEALHEQLRECQLQLSL